MLLQKRSINFHVSFKFIFLRFRLFPSVFISYFSSLLIFARIKKINPLGRPNWPSQFWKKKNHFFFYVGFCAFYIFSSQVKIISVFLFFFIATLRLNPQLISFQVNFSRGHNISDYFNLPYMMIYKWWLKHFLPFLSPPATIFLISFTHLCDPILILQNTLFCYHM